ncbi:hypothetical protein BBO99_00009665 [Phytophthora kernoviae]|uniref:DUSP domain-containing protein n=2 Tax=Phytophthora kernoviae TaxID=325452 RepID=A0A3R7K4D0_9STRA|nr:hypothetical protein G195_010589 [Phytophthora kernoviae 00238/432]KAG2502758.1 hypothetical protein JM16_009632 [Phytophthora kernoviae]KAG2503626.1 hypothetical protein JM18_009598 [Phytophthora kernoviae]RLN14435.1 hypothetical protein BBI17_009638 [Phytophthora kernoviae]RLN72847.1 hypothetical protein BBO99_00009665 [Phytophthora kernoviae]
MIAMFSARKSLSVQNDHLHETPTTPTGDFANVFSGMTKPSAIIAAGLDITSWKVVEINVPAGPLGILLDGSCTEAALLDDFAPVTRDGTLGAVEASGKVPHGSVLIGMDKIDFLQEPRKSLADIGILLRETSHLKRQLYFRVPPQGYEKPQQAAPQSPQKGDNSKLLDGPTSSSVDLLDTSDANKPADQRSRWLWGGPRADGMEYLPAPIPESKPSERAQMVRQISATCMKRMSIVAQPTHTEDTELRRRLEVNQIMKFDRKELKFKECWFAVPAEWMSRWVLFVAKNGPDPGPITNHNLLSPGWETYGSDNNPERAAVVRPELQIMKDFRFVTPMVWSLLSALHGTGEAPAIARYVLDMNSEPVTQQGIDDVLHEVKPQANGLATGLREKCQVQKN